MSCKTCGGEMIQKRRGRLFFVGVLMCAMIAAAPFLPYLWVPATILGLAGIYLIVWATLGKGRWCRKCKKFSIR